jgi:hypothetical protein
MIGQPLSKVVRRSAAALLCLSAASCGPQYSAPQQIQTSNPSVTYKYRGDQELLQADQKAATFCNSYQSVPRAVHFGNDRDGGKTVVYDCDQTPGRPPPPQYNSNLTYNYRTDGELLDASRNAQIYCMNNGGQQAVSNIGTGPNGDGSVSFRCVQR